MPLPRPKQVGDRTYQEVLRDQMYIGLDPGALGGIAILSGPDSLTLVKMPETERDIWDVLQPYGSLPSFAVIEWIHPAIQGVGKSSMSKLYGNYKALRMALIAAEIPFEEVRAAVWQRAMGLPVKGKEDKKTWKNRLKAKSQELFPGAKATLNTCDALLIAEYCRRSRLGILVGGK